ncbi:MAG: DUF5722 domain-containing protein [Polyangiaceae bacterium]
MTSDPVGVGGAGTGSTKDASASTSSIGSTTTGTSSDASTGASGTGGGPPQPLPYPTRTAMRMKGLQPDFWPNKDEVVGNNAGGVAMNLVWAVWEPALATGACGADQEELDGHCFTVEAAVDAAIAEYTDKGVVVTAVVYGVPEWARAGKPCSPVSPGFEIFCSPTNAADYGRFARVIARRYDGLHGHGRVADFVIQNEVNANDWFDVGCGQGTPCDTAKWLDEYAANSAAAYDGILAEQPFAKVLVSLEHHFGASFDAPAASSPLLSGETFLKGFAARVAPRAWRVAYHPYPPNLLAAEFGPDDSPRVTYGNIGALAGFLRKTFPAVPSSWEIQTTESGVNSLAPSSEAAQADGVCRSFHNLLGTPGIESYIYHRMTDHPVEVASGLAVGLHHSDGSAKPAWSTWALANRDDTTPKQLSCGFEDLPYTRLDRSFHPSRGHWASSRLPPAGFTIEQSYHLDRDAQPGTAMLYECRVGQHNVLTLDVGCEGLEPLGPVGFIATQPGAGLVALHRCRVGAGTDHFISPDAGCEGQVHESLLGYAHP